MFNKLRNFFAVIGILLVLGLGVQTYYRAQAGAAVYVWLNSAPAKGQPTRLQTLEALITTPK